MAPITISKPDTFFEISRPSYVTTDRGTIRHYGPSSSAWVVVYRSSTVKESVSPKWDKASIALDTLYSTSSSTSSISLSTYPLLITVYKMKKKKCKEIGSFETTVQALIDAYKSSCEVAKVTGYETESSSNPQMEDFVLVEERRRFLLRPSAHSRANLSDETTGEVVAIKACVECSDDIRDRSRNFVSGNGDGGVDGDTIGDGADDMESYDCASTISSITTNPTIQTYQRPRNARFADYANAGLDIDFCVAIDFTSSNGDPRIPGTLHYTRDGMMNDYEEAIYAVGNTISRYSVTKQFPVWGFGAKYDNVVRHIFQCGIDPAARDIQGVLDAYRTVLVNGLTMSGPSDMTFVLKAAAARSKKNYNSPKGLKYCVLLVLTDGMVNDLPSTQELVRAYRELPLSVVVVGIGRADFSPFHQWNDRSKIDERGRFTFLEFRDHDYNPDALSRNALEKVPQEIVDYFIGRDILPS